MASKAVKRLSAFEARKAAENIDLTENGTNADEQNEAGVSDQIVRKKQKKKKNGKEKNKAKSYDGDDNIEVIDISEEEPSNIIDSDDQEMRTGQPEKVGNGVVKKKKRKSLGDSSTVEFTQVKKSKKVRKHKIKDNRDDTDAVIICGDPVPVKKPKHRKLDSPLAVEDVMCGETRDMGCSAELESPPSSVICIGDSSPSDGESASGRQSQAGRSVSLQTMSDDEVMPEAGYSDDEMVVGESLSWFTLRVSDGYIVVLPDPSEYVLKGRATMCLLVGQVSIQGYHLQQGTPVTVYSPECNSLLTLKTIQSENSITESIIKITGHFKIPEAKASRLRTALKRLRHFVVVHIKAAVESAVFCDVIASLDPHSRLFEIGECDGTQLNRVLAPLGVSLVTCVDTPCLEVTEELERVLRAWGGVDWGTLPSSILVCGGKGAGKSTTNRLLLNNALNRCGEDEDVYYLDFDVGQSEFTPAGCVSLVKVTEPLLGPAFCNQREPLMSYCFHGLSPKDDPDRYLACVRLCVERYQQLGCPGRLVVNTMGWMTGLGLQLLMDAIFLVQPQIIVQMAAVQRNQNIAPLTQQQIMEETSWSDISQEKSYKRVRRSLKYKPNILQVKMPVAPQLMSRFRASDHRNFSLLSHLCRDLDPRATLTSVHPHCIRWRDVAVHVVKGVPLRQVMYSLNASLVALCRTDTSQAEKMTEDGPVFFLQLPPCEWLGYGIVRGVDMQRQLLYVVTSLPLEKLDYVNTLVKGSVTIPDQLLLSQKCGDRAYVDDSKLSLGASAVKPRRHMPRKKLGPVN